MLIGTSDLVPFPLVAACEIKTDFSLQGLLLAGGGALATFQEDAAGVAQPYAVGGPAVKPDVGGKSICSFEHFARLPGGRSAVDDQLDALMFGQVADNFRIHPRDR